MKIIREFLEFRRKSKLPPPQQPSPRLKFKDFYAVGTYDGVVVNELPEKFESWLQFLTFHMDNGWRPLEDNILREVRYYPPEDHWRVNDEPREPIQHCWYGEYVFMKALEEFPRFAEYEFYDIAMTLRRENTVAVDKLLPFIQSLVVWPHARL